MKKGFLARYGWKTMAASATMGVFTVNHIAAGYGHGVIPTMWDDNLLYIAGLLGLVGIGHKVQKAHDAAERAGERVREAVELHDAAGAPYGTTNPLAVAGAGKEVVLLRETAAVPRGSAEAPWVPGFAPYRMASLLLTVTECKGAAEDALDVFVDVRLPDGRAANVVHFPQVHGGGPKHQAYHAVVEAGGTGSIADLTTDAAAGGIRPGLLFDSLRVRHTVTHAESGRSSFTFAVSAWLQS